MNKWIDQHGITVSVICLGVSMIIGTISDWQLRRNFWKHEHQVDLENIFLRRNNECWSLIIHGSADAEETSTITRNGVWKSELTRPVVLVRQDCPE